MLATITVPNILAHGTVVSPISRVYRIYQANPDNPSFALAANAVTMDGSLSYYTWNEVSRNIGQAVQAGLPAGFDYSTWIPDGQLASAGRVDPNSAEYPRTYAGLDQVSADWPTTAVTAGQTINVDFLATAVHSPSVWDVWMTTPDWTRPTQLNWDQMEFLGRPQPVLSGNHFTFDLDIPANRSGHHVLWVAWQRDDPVGEVFISTSDLMITGAPGVGTNYCVPGANSVSSTGAQMSAGGSASVASNDLALSAAPLPMGQPGLFYHGANQTAVPFGNGTRCVAGGTVRISPASLPNASGVLNVTLDNTTPNGAGIIAGATRHFQTWYRDPAGAGAGFNLSDGLTIMFVP